MFDLLIKNARVIDGSGSPWFRADVGVKAGKICFIGRADNVPAAKLVDAGDMFLAPGFIDIHSHSDQTIFGAPRAESRILQGVTTELTGNCGMSMAPASDEYLADLKVYTDGAGDYSWRSMDDFLAKLDAFEHSTNTACLIGHGTVRLAVMGYSAAKPNAKQLDTMRALVAESMQAGAYGITSGLIYPPGSFADIDELASVVSAIAPYSGFYATHMRNEETDLGGSVLEAIATAERAGVPLEISHHKVCYPPEWRVAPKLSIALIERARRRGLDVTCDQYPYRATATTLSVNIPDWAFEGGFDAVKRRLADKATHERIRAEVDAANGEYWGDYVVSGLGSKKNEWMIGKTIPQIAQKLGLPPTEAFFQIIVEEDNHVDEIHFAMCEEDIEYIMQQPFVMIGSDGSGRDLDAPGSPHPRNYGTFPRVLAHYCRDRHLFPLEEAVRKMTGAPANRIGLRDRGFIREGMAADMVIFDFAALKDDPSYIEPKQACSGIKQVYVNGVLSAENGKHTGALAGKVLRKSR